MHVAGCAGIQGWSVVGGEVLYEYVIPQNPPQVYYNNDAVCELHGHAMVCRERYFLSAQASSRVLS